MDESFMRGLGQLQHDVAALGEVLEEVVELADSPAEGWDDARVVKVSVAADGTPESIWVESHWQREVAPEAMGAAVMAAAQAAVVQRQEAWAQALTDSNLISKLEQVGADPSSPASAAPPVSPPGLAYDGTSRPLEDLVEEVLSISEEEIKAASAEWQNRTGGAGPAGKDLATEASATSGPLRVTLSADGSLHCHMDPDWVANQSGQFLTSALTHELHVARSRPAKPPPGADFTARLERLTAEAASYLMDPTLFNRSGRTRDADSR